MKQGEIWQARLDPVEGREQSGIRPVLIISGEPVNEYTDLVIICPMTTSIKQIKKCIILEPTPHNNLKHDSQLLPFQIRALSKDRLIKYIGAVDDSTIEHLISDLIYFLS